MLLVCPPTLTGCFRLEMRNADRRFSIYQGPGDLFRLEMRTAGKRFSLYQGPGDLFRLEMRTAGKRFSLYQGPVDLFRLEIGKEKVFRSCNQLTISLSTQSSIIF